MDIKLRDWLEIKTQQIGDIQGQGDPKEVMRKMRTTG